MPSLRELQGIFNDETMLQLEEDGVDLEAPHMTTHYAYFETSAQQSSFKKWLGGQGFENIVMIEAPKDEDGYIYGVSFSKKDTLLSKEFDTLTFDVFDKASELEGVYDGWIVELKD
jgi:hypothetical protein